MCALVDGRGILLSEGDDITLFARNLNRRFRKQVLRLHEYLQFEREHLF